MEKFGSDDVRPDFGWNEIGSIVPLGRAIFLMIPGTSCLATIVLSLRDKAIRPSRRLTIILALMGLNQVETLGFSNPFGAVDRSKEP